MVAIRNHIINITLKSRPWYLKYEIIEHETGRTRCCIRSLQDFQHVCWEFCKVVFDYVGFEDSTIVHVWLAAGGPRHKTAETAKLAMVETNCMLKFKLCKEIAYPALHTWRGWRIQSEGSSKLFGSKRPVAGLNLLVHAWNTEGYGFIEFEISNSTVSFVFRQPLIRSLQDVQRLSQIHEVFKKPCCYPLICMYFNKLNVYCSGC